ncbi:MAG TPA: site-2 protease family protein [Candidatus Nanoarchaeia archaeon]|nr:site-2 protease family protein [Candidatus Nanoarchaeia archaeon]
MSFIIIDLILFVLFTIATVLFLYKRRSNLKRQGALYLYPTQVGVKFIEQFTKKYHALLRPLQYLILISGFALMITIVIALINLSYTYFTSPYLAEALKIPVLTPLIPYLPELFKLDYLPHFYFTYWIIIIAVIAIPHEFAHGIYSRLHKIKVRSTGFGFLGPFIAAFVEPDEKQMEKAPIKAQMSILAAGTFANLLMTLLFGIIFALFFLSFFSPAGVYIQTYTTAVVPTNSIFLNGTPLSQAVLPEKGLLEIISQNTSYLAPASFLQIALKENHPTVGVYENAPAINKRLQGAITHINNQPVSSKEELARILTEKRPGETVTITTATQSGKKNTTELTLGSRNGKAYLGIGFPKIERTGVSGLTYKGISLIADPSLYYNSKLGELGFFFKDLLWWLVLINASVALMNMLPVGIFDGGRFFYLTVLSITDSKQIAKQAFKISTWIFIALAIALMLKWVFIYI